MRGAAESLGDVWDEAAMTMSSSRDGYVSTSANSAAAKGENKSVVIASSDDTSSHATDDTTTALCRRRARTHSVFVEQRDIESLVVEYSNIDNTYLSTLGKQAKLYRWKLLISGLAELIDIEMHVDKEIMHEPKVSITANGERIFPAYGQKEREKMREDFTHKWNFRGIPEGFREGRNFEVRPNFGSCSNDSDKWYPASLTTRRPDGTYEGTALVPTGVAGLTQELVVVGIRVEDIRYRETKKPIKFRSRTVLLTVPHDAPDKASFKMVNLREASEDDGIDMTFFFGRWTPAGSGAHCEASPDGISRPKTASPTVMFDVCCNALGQESLTANVGHTVLSHFMSDEVCAVSSTRTPHLMKGWVIQVGPFTEHTIAIERRSKHSNIIALSVDGELLVESTAADLGDAGASTADGWSCGFRLVGDKFLEFKMDQAYTIADKAKNALEKQVIGKDERSAYPDYVSTPVRIVYDCFVSMPSLKKISDAVLTINTTDFRQLRSKMALPPEACLTGPAEVFRKQYGIVAPRGVVANSLTNAMTRGGLAWPVESLSLNVTSLKSTTDSASASTLSTLQYGLGNFMNTVFNKWDSSSVPTDVALDDALSETMKSPKKTFEKINYQDAE